MPEKNSYPIINAIEIALTIELSRTISVCSANDRIVCTAVSSRGANIFVTLDIFGSNFCYAKVKNFVTLQPKFLLRTKFSNF